MRLKIAIILLIFSLVTLIRVPISQLRNNKDRIDRIIIPKIEVDAPIVENFSVTGSEDTLVVNFLTDFKGKVVIYGHRYTHKNLINLPLFRLDILKEGDEILLIWKGKSFKYSVYDIEVVDPSETWIFSQTDRPELLLITCTPLFNPTMRLVVFSRLVSID